ncbi:MAG: alpha/beta fold hydrolase [Acetobacteraceae bacterium]|nr:alpha/beta fold hydrolase [Acetobacteraceae bacterium]
MSLDRVTAAGCALLRRGGTGTPLVLLHGIGSDAESWGPLIAALDPARPVLAWDAPGYGASAPLTPEAPSPADYAARLLAVFDALGIGRAVVVGHSLGCLFTGAFAAAHPDRVAAAAFLSPALGYAVPAGAPLPPAVQARIDDLAALGPAAFAEKRASRLVFEPERKPQVLAGVRRAMSAVNLPGYAQAVRALGAGRLLDDARRVMAPALVAIGAEDVVTPPANAHRLHPLLPDPAGPVRIIPGCGHALPQEAPAEVAALLEALHVG